jgi:alpha-galactosidase
MKERRNRIWQVFCGLLCLILILTCFGCSHRELQREKEETKLIWLDELGAQYAEEGWGQTQANKSIDGNPLSVAGRKFKRGLGTHADGCYRIKLDGKAISFIALVGIDDEIGGNEWASVEFSVVAYDENSVPKLKLLWESGLMKAGQSAIKADVNIEDIKEIRLIVSDGGNGINYDHADWAEAKIEYLGSKPEPVKPYTCAPYILTPEPGPAPKINGAKIFGVRPGSQFLFTIPATGDRPLTFLAEGLPGGLTLDSKSGRITGIVNKEGVYNVKLIAKNETGQSERDFRIVVGDTICLTPPMGWNSWNCWAYAVTDENIRASARAMVEKGLINHGWTYINIDDCWMIKPDSDDPILCGEPRDENGMPLTNKKFLDMKALTDYIHDLGLKAGIYTSPGPYTCQGFTGSYEYEAQDAKQFADWGFDYLKYDWCYYSKIAKDKSLEELKKPYIQMRDELLKQSRDIIYSLCQYGMGEAWKWGEEVGGNCWRTTGDIVDSWSSMSKIGFSQNKCSKRMGT